ncbi:unnamed protein product [Sphagnum troendelagicum]|uniref:Uncharacterized protein n=1 Tax=Sphagnum troendelagicum TaxID=128251 RepID=A0ABP0TFC3_9BRYO|nr:hypothetical protein BDL97_10G098000 [Sphagnum fallax]KAH9550863.1 hypothetical protein CY35_10G094100 [Sphagnum magellanicum]
MVRGTRFGKISEGIVTAFGGVRGAQNVAAWGVAGIVAYYLWIKPERELRLEQEEARFAALMRDKDRHAYVERRRPMPDPQDTGLIRGKVKDPS